MLLQVLAAGVNNTEINTRLGWYSSAVDIGTEELNKDKKRLAKVGGMLQPHFRSFKAPTVAASWLQSGTESIEHFSIDVA